MNARRYLTECYDELGTQYKVPIYCLSYPINIVKEDNGRDSPAEYSEPVDGGVEVTLKLRLSSSFSDTKLTVYSKDTIGQCKKKLQVSQSILSQITIDIVICMMMNTQNIKSNLCFNAMYNVHCTVVYTMQFGASSFPKIHFLDFSFHHFILGTGKR